jgi:hypothetical protein
MLQLPAAPAPSSPPSAAVHAACTLQALSSFVPTQQGGMSGAGASRWCLDRCQVSRPTEGVVPNLGYNTAQHSTAQHS